MYRTGSLHTLCFRLGKYNNFKYNNNNNYNNIIDTLHNSSLN